MIQQAKRPEIQTVLVKVNHHVIEGGFALLPEAQEPAPLRLSLNRPFAELEEVPYALGLIRQSLNRQLDDNGGIG